MSRTFKVGVVLFVLASLGVIATSVGPLTVAARHRVVAPDPNPTPLIGGLRERSSPKQPGRWDNFSASRGDVTAAASSALAARMIQAEAEYLYRRTSLRWLGQEPRAGTMAIYIWHSRVETHLPRGSISLNEKGIVTDAEIAMVGDLEAAMERQLPREMTKVVISRHLHEALRGQYAPSWVRAGTPVIDTLDDQEQLHQFDRCVEFLAKGQLPRLKEMIEKHSVENDRNQILAQGYALTRFLVTLKGRPALLRFVEKGVVGGDWDKAASEVYEFKSLDALEAAWRDWLKKPESRPVLQK
jgi:hypothetical protein